MKNKLSVLIVLAIFMVIALGCSMIWGGGKKNASTDKSTSAPSSDSNKSVTDKAIEDIADGETTGVQECDDLMKLISEQSQNPDDNWVTKGIRDYAIGQVKKSLRESIEQNKNDKKKMAEQCTDLRKSFEKALKEQKDKDSNK